MKSKIRISILSVTCSALLFLAGCAETQRYETVKQVCVVDVEKAEAMQAAKNALGEMYFTIEKADAEAGYIKTRPLRAAQSFEFWRSDNVGAFNLAEANLHSIRRTAELQMNHQDGKLYIGCEVKAQKLHLLRHQTSGARPYVFEIQNLRFKIPKEDLNWVDLGQDEKLATEILKRIEKQIASLQKEKQL